MRRRQRGTANRRVGILCIVRRPIFSASPKSEKLSPSDTVESPDAAEAARRARNRDEDRSLTFDQIKAKYEGRIYSLIYRMVNDPDDAQDLTVETFLNAWRHWGRFRGDAQVYTWLYQIAVNNCKNRFKQRDRQRGREVMSLDEGIETDSGEVGREVADWSAAPERLLMDKELLQKLQEAVESLAPEYREVLILAQYDGLPYEEIAKILGLTEPTVKTRLHRARLKVRQRLEPYYQGWMASDRRQGE